MILILAGASASGKTTIRDKLIQKQYENLPTVTDRPIRPNEKRGVDYDFVAPEVFDQLMRLNYFIETTSYHVATNDDRNIWRYGTPRYIFKSKDDNPFRVTILNPKAIQAISYTIPKEQYCLCYLVSNEKTIRQRLKQRGDNQEEIERRIAADKIDFDDFHFDIMIRNTLDDDIDKVAKDVDACYRVWKEGKER